MASSSSFGFKLKVFAAVEALAIMIALVMPITPSKTGKPFKWPETWAEYFDDFLFSLVLGNALLIVLFAAGWIYVKWSEVRSPRSEVRSPRSEVTNLKSESSRDALPSQGPVPVSKSSTDPAPGLEFPERSDDRDLVS